MFRNLFVFIFLIHLVKLSDAQDVVITLTAKNLGTPVKLDSIFLENLDAPGSLMLNVVSFDITSYDINLSKGKIINRIGDLFQNNYGFHLYSNEPGLLRFYTVFPKDEQISLNLYDLMGRNIAHHELISPAGSAIISYSHGGNPAGIVVVKGMNHLQTFKVTGGDIDRNPVILVPGAGTLKNDPVQRSYNFAYSPGDFTFTPGDAVRFTVYQHSIYPGSLARYPAHGDSLVVMVSRPCPDTPFVSDFEGNLYTTVRIGNQCWMRENMRTRHYSNGDTLVNGNGMGYYDPYDTTKYWFDYDDDPNVSAIYGRLYTWSAVMNGIHGPNFSMIQGICPAGWHVPTDEEWLSLENFLGWISDEAKQMEWGGTNAGGKLKEAGYEHWLYPNVGATNESGFSALPGGAGSPMGYSFSLKYEGYWWTATPDELDPEYKEIYLRMLSYGLYSIEKFSDWRGFAYSIRCLKN